ACGGLPALRGSRADLARLREGGRGSTGRSHAVRHVLVAGQAALALVLLIGSGLLLRSAWELRHVDPGYDTRDILTFQIAPHRPELNDAVSYARFNLAFLDRLAALPGVRSAGIVENVPIDEATARIRVRTETTEAGSDGVPVNVTFSAGDYFRTMGIALKAGRTFGADDHGVTRGNILVSESAARLLWPGRDPLGQRLQRSAGSPWETVVGVVGDVLQDGLQSEVQPLVYFPLVGPAPDGGRARSSPGFALRTTVPAESLVPAVRALVRELAPEAPLYRVHTMQELAERSMQQVDFSLLTLGLAALLALVLGAVGLYAVLSQVVAERTREIGVRMALGARAGQVRAMVVGQGFRVVAIGMLVGLGAALAATRVLGSLLYGVVAHDLATFLVMTFVMGAVGLFASWLPAWRASRLDPVESLRRE
ncbi:MAG: FtsX-like permease family protein, partial [Xanthomonadales bacterium]|nr:FtsX-like permease family protein [Xanthomonadales bacterium]